MKKYVSLEKLLELMAVDIVRSDKHVSFDLRDPRNKDIDDVDISDGIVPLRTQRAYVEALLPCMIRENGEVVSLPCEPADPVSPINFRWGACFVMYTVTEPWVDDLRTAELHIKDFYSYEGLKTFIEENMTNIETFSLYVLVDNVYRKVDYKADYNVYTREWSNFSIPLFEQ